GLLTGRLQTLVQEETVTVTLDGRLLATVSDPDLAPGGVLGEGRALLYDGQEKPNATPRVYDNLEVFPLNFEAANFANQDALLSHEGLFRMGPTGEAYGPIAKQISDLPRVPVSGPEERP